MPTIMAYAFQMLAGMVIIYLVIGSQVNLAFQGIDLSWLANINSEFAPEGYKLRAVFGSLLSTVIWWRGGRVGAVGAVCVRSGWDGVGDRDGSDLLADGQVRGCSHRFRTAVSGVISVDDLQLCTSDSVGL